MVINDDLEFALNYSIILHDHRLAGLSTALVQYLQLGLWDDLGDTCIRGYDNF